MSEIALPIVESDDVELMVIESEFLDLEDFDWIPVVGLKVLIIDCINVLITLASQMRLKFNHSLLKIQLEFMGEKYLATVDEYNAESKECRLLFKDYPREWHTFDRTWKVLKDQTTRVSKEIAKWPKLPPIISTTATNNHYNSPTDTTSSSSTTATNNYNSATTTTCSTTNNSKSAATTSSSMISGDIFPRFIRSRESLRQRWEVTSNSH